MLLVRYQLYNKQFWYLMDFDNFSFIILKLEQITVVIAF